MELIDRRPERRVLDEVLRDLRSGRSQALVVHGEAGVGKSALIEYLAGRASGCHLARAPGVQSEMELAFAGLHQLCAPMLDRLDRLPGPQRDALQTAFGLTGGPAPDQFLIGLAVLSLLSEVAEERPLLCLIDDQQWIDRASAQALAFVARRLQAESVAMVFGVRQPGEELAGLAELVVSGLPVADARELLASALRGPLDSRVRDQIVAETRGNPLALLEIPRGLTPAELAGGYGFPDMAPIPADMEDTFGKRIQALPEPTRRLLVLAAADATGDPGLVWRAAALLGIPADAAAPATQAGLAEFGTRIRFRHPLVRSATYQSATPAEQQHAHGALAQVINPATDAERRAWHRAHAVTGPDDDVAEELEHSAGQAQARGGLAAAAAFLERATMLTLDPTQRATRALSAATAKIEAGALDAALDLLATAEMGPLNDLQQARADLVRAQLAFVTNRSTDAPPLLLKAAQRLATIDADLSRSTYLESLSAAVIVEGLAVGGAVVEVASALAVAPPPTRTPRSPDFLLDALPAWRSDGYAAAVPLFRRALAGFGTGMSPHEECRSLWLACMAAIVVWDDDSWDTLSDRHVRLARSHGALSEIPLALTSRALMLVFIGDLAAAASLIEELDAATEATGLRLAPFGAMVLTALSGDRAKATALIETTSAEAAQRGEGISVIADWARAALNNGAGNYEAALVAAGHSVNQKDTLGPPPWALVELIEAAARSGRTETAIGAVHLLTEQAVATGTDWALGVEARARALLSEGDTADSLYRQAIEHLNRTRVRAELARAHLLYGEWLRRERRRVDARSQLRIARELFEAMGMSGFAQRARRELLATGETARKRTVAMGTDELTAQETLIARMARDGLSNPEIGTRLFISHKTVQYHLSKVFAKLDITSRSQLGHVLDQ
jgi:DNA-binding CsgD family transcriptional regulator